MIPPQPQAPALGLYWAKSPRKEPDSTAYHPLLCHLIDVAVVTGAIWQHILSPGGRATIAKVLELPVDDVGRLLAFWAGAHDIGKCSPCFQLQLQAARDRFRAAGLPYEPPLTKAPHGVISARVLEDTLPRDFSVPTALAKQVAAAVGGHHGRFPKPNEPFEIDPAAMGKARWDGSRRALLTALADMVRPPAVSVARVDPATAFWIAGLVSVADWIGSNEDYFHFAVPDHAVDPAIDFQHYSAAAEGRALEALQSLGWMGWHPRAEGHSFEAMFDFPPNRMQRAVVDLAAQMNEPGLVIVEAAMGEGKTEAAQYLADHWTVRLGQGGSYFALPTQATSNQMFGRVASYLRRRYPDEIVNFQLLHGHATLSAEFEELRRNGYRVFAPSAVAEDVPGRTADVVAAGWFTHRKRGLLAPFGVGTVDQALMAVLQVNHVFVRLFGLAHKTVIVDEVHAYDTYMSTLLERLLQWLGALGSPVVLLSATLPNSRREALVNAYRAGAAGHVGAVPPARYPRITSYTKGHGARVEEIDLPEEAQKVLRLHRLPDDSEPGDAGSLGRYLVDRLSDGGCAAVICNTVRKAQEVYTALLPLFPRVADDGLPELDLLHARFLFEDRHAREQRTLLRFGKEGTAETVGEGSSAATIPVRRPTRAVLIATQVVEQSLDLDFDLMVSQTAPVDLLLQRSGRLHRHPCGQRPPGLKEPTLALLEHPTPEGAAPGFDGGTAAVYDGHVLLRTWLALRDRTSIEVPGDIEELVEGVYQDKPRPEGVSPAVRDAWTRSLDKQADEREKDRAQAANRYLKPPTYHGHLEEMMHNPREEDAPGLHPEFQALTRIADEPSAQAIFLVRGDDGVVRLRPSGRQVDLAAEPTVREARDLLLRSAPITGWGPVNALQETPSPSGWAEMSLLRHCYPIILDGRNRARLGHYEIQLDDRVGVVVEKRTKEDR